MNVGIVGSRKYRNKRKVEAIVDTLIRKTGGQLIIVSGGCKTPKDKNGVPQNVDKWAEKYAKNQGIPVNVYLPNLSETRGHWAKVVKEYYKRNEKIVLTSDIIFAFLVGDSGGAWNTVEWCRKYNKPLVMIYENGKIAKERCGNL